MCVCVYIYMCVCVYCAFVGMDNELYKMHGTYFEIFMVYCYSATNTNDVHRSDCIMTLYLLPTTDGLILYVLLLMTTTTSTLHILGKVLR
jgi:hypothetical protein